MFAVTVTSNVAKCRDRGFERGEAMREIVRIIARIMRKKRARRRSKNSTTVFKKQGRFTRYTSVRVTTMHSNDSNLSGNYFDSTCVLYRRRERDPSLFLSLSPGLFKRGQRRRGNDSPSLSRFLCLVSSFQRRERGFDAIFHDSTWNLIPWILAFLDRDSPRATANLRV